MGSTPTCTVDATGTSRLTWQLYVAEFPNGKRYFGITKFALAKRISLHFSAAFKKHSRFRVHCAIREYGQQARTFFRTAVIGDKDYIFDLEEKAIRAFRTRNPNFGYNMPKKLAPSDDDGDSSKNKRSQ